MGSTKKRVQYSYDAVGNRIGMVDPDGGRFTYAYDNVGRTTSVVNPQGERTSYSYDANGRQTLKQLANGTRASFTYDDANQLTVLGNLKSDGTVISQFDYSYDKAGNRTAVAEADGSRVTWLYDDTYQLTEEHRTGSTPFRNTFRYDSAGNRTLKNEAGTRTTYAYDPANQLRYGETAGGRTTYTYDADGNQQLVTAPNNDRTTTLWDYENKATEVQLPSGIRNTMSYAPDGLRVKLEDSTGTKKFVWEATEAADRSGRIKAEGGSSAYLAETDENNDTQVIYTNEPAYYGNLISQRRGSNTSYYHYEALGSTRELTDATEAITDTYLYDAWGVPLATVGSTINPFQYVGNVGYYFDPDTQDNYIRARIYRPTIGRWVSVDPLGFVDGANLYAALFIPNQLDPSGQSPNAGNKVQKNARARLKALLQKFADKYSKYCFFEATGMEQLVDSMIRSVGRLWVDIVDLIDDGVNYDAVNNKIDFTGGLIGSGLFDSTKIPDITLLHEFTHVLDDFSGFYLSDVAILRNVEKAEALAYGIEYIVGNLAYLKNFEDAAREPLPDCTIIEKRWDMLWRQMSKFNKKEMQYTYFKFGYSRFLNNADLLDVKVKLGVHVSCNSLESQCYSEILNSCCLSCPFPLPSSLD